VHRSATISDMAKSNEKAADKARPKDGRIADILRVPPGPVDLTAVDSASTPGYTGDKDGAKSALANLGPRLADLQERLFAHGQTGGQRRVLLVLQGMDTSGKGGTVRHVMGQVDPQGVSIKSFKPPTKAELAHGFLWRIRRALPGPGMLGVFDRSHYEDVLVVRVHDLVPKQVWARRFATINRFEESLVAGGMVVIKCFLHISREESAKRLLTRLDDPTKHWKFNPQDVDERAYWGEYQLAYDDALERCTSEDAPWHIVPSDRKWYRNWAIMNLLIDHLGAMGLDWPPPDYDIEEERRRLLATG
jgi:PPK2 family polyphosphate:nucleotide phosphotransferase